MKFMARVGPRLRGDDKEEASSPRRRGPAHRTLGIVANHFDRIDVRRSGRVSFEDLKRYLRGRGAGTF